jgi:hypothetical protein
MENPNKLKAFLADTCQTMKWLAEKLGKKSATVAKWFINTTQPAINTLAKISDLPIVFIRDF